MRGMKNTFFLLCIVFVLSLFARSSIWKVSDTHHTLFLGGTIHVLRTSDYPLPEEFDQAYAQSDFVVFETDIALSQSRTFEMMLAKKMLLPPEQTLSQLLTPQTYHKLGNYLASQGYSNALFEHMQPWALMMTLTQTTLAKMGIDQNGVDIFYAQRALKDHKPQKHLESVEEQLAIISEIGKGEEDVLVEQTLRDMSELNETMAWMVRDWREGKTRRLEDEMVNQMLEESPKMYRLILKNRNDAWMPKLRSIMDEGKIGFVLVGTMHLLGPDGLLERFRKMGYRVEPF
ncbi:TraB/GumN family protein [Sulfuricurvum sp.]|uniref:TraB/GumN family protein n=1 Tax=Sulfuricurvum sp. TaxID=2025608 RepID=UPI00260A4404|nr:TraB/GumN family protein [Sulfuricurvum sp.]